MDPRDEGQVRVNIPSPSPFANHTTQLLTPGASPGASASSPGADQAVRYICGSDRILVIIATFP